MFLINSSARIFRKKKIKKNIFIKCFACLWDTAFKCSNVCTAKLSNTFHRHRAWDDVYGMGYLRQTNSKEEEEEDFFISMWILFRISYHFIILFSYKGLAGGFWRSWSRWSQFRWLVTWTSAIQNFNIAKYFTAYGVWIWFDFILFCCSTFGDALAWLDGPLLFYRH